MHSIWLILFRVVIGYLLLIILMKFMGKREIGQLSLFDLLILLSIVDIMVVGIENFNDNYFYSVIPMVFIAVIQKVIAKLSLKSLSFRNLMDGKEVLIIDKGKVLVDVMNKNGYNMSDLYHQLREQGYSSPSLVKYAILENSGKLSIINNINNNTFIFPIIISGNVIEENLLKADVSIYKVKSFLNKQGIKDIKDVYGLDIINGEFKLVDVLKK